MTWDDSISDGDSAPYTWPNNIISAIKARGATKVLSRDAYTDWECDGTADDVQLAAAFTALGANGGSISLGIGTYVITAKTSPSNGKFTLFGQGRENTILKLGNNCHILNFENDIDDITVRDLSFDGTKASYNSDMWSGITGGTADSVLIENCDFYNFEGKGVYPATWTNFHIRNCRFYSNGQDGLYLEGTVGSPTARGQITDCISFSNGRKGFNNGIIKDIVYSNCIAYSNTTDGWNIEGSDDGTYQLENVKLIGCTSYSNTQYGFRIQMQDYNVSLINCHAYSNTLSGLYIRGHDTHTMKNIQVIGGSYYNNTANGISVHYGINHLKLMGLSVYNNDQGDTGNDGISFGDTTNFEHFILSDIHAYDDQGAATQDRGVDFGTGDESAKDIIVRNLWGEGNTTELFRGTVTKAESIQDLHLWQSGTSTGTGAQQNIEHGLSVTPNRVFLSPSATNAIQTSGANATYIFITADNTEDYYWLAMID